MMMSMSNGFVFPFVLFLVSTSVFSQNQMSLVFGSSVNVGEQNFSRVDPLRQFKLYKGGYDIRNKHYWASAAFTGVHGYAMAGIWMLCGLGFGSYVILKLFNGSSSLVINHHSDSSYLNLFLLVLLFSFLALVATSIVITANQKTQQRTKMLEQTILGAGSDAHHSIRKVRKAINEMQVRLRPYDPETCNVLNLTAHRLGNESRMIQQFVRKNKLMVNGAILTSYITNLLVVTFNLVLLVSALVLLLFHWHPGFIIIILFCWILTTLCWVLTGFDFFFYTFAKDTCSALEDFEQKPQNNSLNSILPCSNSSNSDAILVKIGYIVHKFIAELNSKMIELQGLFGLDEETGYSLGIRDICDPFTGAPNYSYTPEKCPKNSISVGDLPNVLSRFTCYNYTEDSTRKCEGEGRFVPEAMFIMALAYSKSIQDLIDIFPDLQSLTHCSFVEDAFSEAVMNHCKPFKSWSRMLWSSMLSLSIVMVVLELIWVVKVYQDRGRCFSVCSIVPKPR